MIRCELASSKSSALFSHRELCHTEAHDGGSVFILKQKEHSTVENDSCAHHKIFSNVNLLMIKKSVLFSQLDHTYYWSSEIL